MLLGRSLQDTRVLTDGEKVKAVLPPCDVGVGNAEHVQRSLVQLEEDAIVDLPQAEQLHHLAGTRVHAVDTANKQTPPSTYIPYVRPAKPENK